MTEKTMPEVSDSAKVRAAELLAEVHHRDDCTMSPYHPLQCGCGLIDASMAVAAFIQRTSDAAQAVLSGLGEPIGYHKSWLAPFILPEPVDPLLIEAREVLAAQVRPGFAYMQFSCGDHDRYCERIREGGEDDGSAMMLALTALRRGMELAKEPTP